MANAKHQQIHPLESVAANGVSELDKRWQNIRDLRNRVFHHERILHWKDLDAQHQAIIEIIAWMSPELCDLAGSLDRFVSIRKAGLDPWIDKLQNHWPKP